MIDYKDQILDYLIKERDYLKKETEEIRREINEMYRKSPADEWQEINDVYENALFIKVFDLIADKLSVPVDEIYCELEEMTLSEILEPSN